MECSVEISMYPLNKNYKKPIVSFIHSLRKYPFIKVKTNGMSTQVFGNYNRVMKAIKSEIENSFINENKIVFNLKILNGNFEEKPSL